MASLLWRKGAILEETELRDDSGNDWSQAAGAEGAALELRHRPRGLEDCPLGAKAETP